MSEKEKQAAQNLVAAIKAVPEGKRDYFLGFAEGAAAAAKAMKPEKEDA